MQKIVFLDIDGVLNNWEWIERNRLELHDSTKYFDPACVEKLNRILSVTGADVVLSTSWRIVHPRDELEGILRAVGVVANIVDETPRGTFNDRRYDEIRAWLRLNMYEGRYVILDDSVHTFEADTPEEAERIIHTTMNHGLLESHVVAAIHVLGEK